ncbi:MAG TPA: sulfate ABC transporter ATP-binding protein [Crenalkalicoccus sp.]|jgi:sulfate transport system ATP-binding protein|nr:sulfate ABC transporter ATP-binding protein [Crenalkalicoccus sp.]
MVAIAIENVVKRYGGRAGNPAAALDGVSLTAREGELLAMVGPSGSGKTTLLRAIAGLETIEGGRILLGGEDATSIPARERRIGFVFQHYALFRHMSVFENVAFGLRARKRRERPAEAAIRARVMELLEMVQLSAFAERRPSALSGGQRQRVALARALAIEPRVLLLDEPFGALDAKVRRDLRRWLRELHERLGLTTLFVTHDQEEALELADRVAILNKGRLEQIGAPAEVYDTPATPFVAEFLGDAVRVPVRPGFLRHVGTRDAAVVLVRPHDIEVRAPEPAAPGVPGRVLRAVSRGGARLLELELDDGTRLEAEVARSNGAAEGFGPGAQVLVHARVAHAFGDAPRA